MTDLEKEGTLSWQNFVETYNPTFKDNSFMRLFNQQNDECLNNKSDYENSSEETEEEEEEEEEEKEESQIIKQVII